MIRKNKDGSVEIHATEEVFRAIDKLSKSGLSAPEQIESWNGIIFIPATDNPPRKQPSSFSGSLNFDEMISNAEVRSK